MSRVLGACVFLSLVPLAAPPARADDEVAQLKEQVARQQEQIEELRRALGEQRRILERTLETLEGARAAGGDNGDSRFRGNDRGGMVARVEKADSASARGGENVGGAESAAPAIGEAELVRDELDALAEHAAQSNERLTRLEKNFASATSAGVAGWEGTHPFIRSRDGNFEMRFGGRMQLDWRSYTGTGTPPASFFLRRARLEAEGQLSKHYEYRVQFDVADSGSRLLRDGFLNINYAQPFQIQFGQFKAPFSQEELQSSKYLDFVERSSVNNLVPSRSPGIMFHGKLAAGAVEYYAGAFNARRELEPNTASTPEGYVRLRFSPFKSSGPEALKNFSFGGAFADGRHRGESSFVGRTASRSVTFFRAVPVDGEIVRANAEFWWRYKRFSLRGEYDQTHQSREGLGADGTNLPGVIGKGLVLQTTYLLTGEEKKETGTTPKASFLGGERGPGAWELAFRYENLQMHDSTNPNRGEAFTFGVNWWLTKFVRYQSNFTLERFKDPTRAATPGDTSHFAYLSRMQVIF